MPKIKTRKSAAKRYSITGSGKVKYKKQGLRHILTKKGRKRKRKLRQAAIISPAEARRARQLVPYAR
ncbi:MAG: 50S ribosomal protein L35 [Spirochaetaceae bacterium]|nr:50S ribosomal protein L35 [Spirochaetaceae bacterium]MDE0227864.1 50S ribosomal protein L35 [Spirochaetaceae bacterium]MDE0447996.1 50S ribosomal protein L35 [Spirochaetaceae bacterium]